MRFDVFVVVVVVVGFFTGLVMIVTFTRSS